MNTSNGNSRREFVKQSSIIAGGILAAPLLSKANYFSGADDTIKIAIIGCGCTGGAFWKQWPWDEVLV